MPNPSEDDFGPWEKTTPADGRVVFSQLVVDDYRIETEHADYVGSDDQIYLDESGRQPIYYLTALADSGLYRLTIQLNSTSGGGIADASITIDGTTKQTDADGSVYFDLAPATYTVQISHPDYVDASQTITIGESNTTETYALDPETSDTTGPGSSAMLRTSATVSAGESLSVTVYEDVGDTGSVDQSATVSVTGGTTEWELDQFTPDSGNSYYASADFSATTFEATPSLHSVEVVITSLTPIGAVYGEVGTTAYEIPVYDPAELSDPRFQARLPGGQLGALALKSQGTSPLECRTPDGAVHGVVVDPQ